MAASPLAQLADTGNDLEERFKAHADDIRSPEFKTVVADLRVWLLQCVDEGRFLPPGSPDRRNLQGQVDYWTSRLLQAGQWFDDVDRIARFDSTAGRVLPAEPFPYHGLLAVTKADGRMFVGREEQTKEYADHIDDFAALLIHCESGGGKSSVAMAGVLPELQRRHPEWLVLARVTPGAQPADTLRSALLSTLSIASADAAAVQSALADGTMLVYVDQLEELLTMCSDVRQQAEFSSMLAALAESGHVKLLATMRVDHYGRLAASAACHPLYRLLTSDGSVKTLQPMSLAQIHSVILKPAEAVGLRFVPPSIVEMLASETVNLPGGLPLLQFALQRLWDERPRQADGQPLDMITADSVSKLPTLSMALGTVAEAYYKELEQQGLAAAARRLMLELTVIDERLEVPRRRRRVESDIRAVLRDVGLAADTPAQSLIDGMAARKLLVRTGSGADRQIEVAHEALFRHWGRFQQWLVSDEVRATLCETQQIARDALLWEQKQRSSELLNLRGEMLRRALQHRGERWLDPLTVAYVKACEQGDAATVAADEAAVARQAKARSLRFRRVGTAFVLALVTGFAGYHYGRAKALELCKTSSSAYVLPSLPSVGRSNSPTVHERDSF